MEAICLDLTWIVVRIIVREIIMVGPSVCLVPSVGMITVALISQFKVDIVIVQIVEADALLLIPGQHAGSLVHIVIIREPAVRPVCCMIGLEGLPDFGSFFGLEFFRSS